MVVVLLQRRSTGRNGDGSIVQRRRWTQGIRGGISAHCMEKETVRRSGGCSTQGVSIATVAVAVICTAIVVVLRSATVAATAFDVIVGLNGVQEFDQLG